MKLSKKLSKKEFSLSVSAIFICSLIFLGGLYYLLNIQYRVSSNPFVYGPVTMLPKTLTLEILEPDDSILVFDSNILISGNTLPFTNVLISSQSNDMIIKSDAGGSFSARWDLDEGVNTITIAAIDADGDSKSVRRTIYFSKEKI